MPVTTRSRRLRRHNTPELTTDILLHHIVPRLPAKSVLHLMAVCKEFHSFLNTHQFAKMHLRHVIDDHHHKFLVLSRDSEREGGWLFSSIDRETTPTPAPSLLVPFLAPNMTVLSSFHGLVCVGIHHASLRVYTDLILWNPATGDYKILSKSNNVIEGFEGGFEGFGLYYSSCDDDYKLLHVTIMSEVYMYSLKSDSWRKLVVGLECNFLKFWSTRSVWLKENLYFVGGLFTTNIMRFDTITEKITIMKLPRSDFPVKVTCTSLFVHKGYVHLCVRSEGSYGNVKYDTWRMNGDDGDWSMVDTYNMDKEVPLARRRQHLIRNGEWLMIHPKKDCIDHILYMFDSEKKAYAYTYTSLDTSVIIPEEGRYTETLVSPNQYLLA